MKRIIVFILFIMLLGNSPMQDFHSQKWFQLADQFIYFDKKIVKDEMEKKQTFVDNIGNRDEVERKFAELEAPSEEAIIYLLSSSEKNEIIVGAAAIYLTKEFNQKYLPKLIEILESNKDYYVKRYLLLALKKSPTEGLINFADYIINSVREEKDAAIIFQKCELLLKLPSQKSAKVLTELLGGDSIQIRRIAFAYLQQLGDEYLDEALDIVAKERKINKNEILNELRKRP